MPAVALFVGEGFVEPAGDGRGHDFHVVVVDAPVQPAELYALLSALFNHRDEGFDGFDAFRVVAEGRVDEEVLHVDDDEQGLGRIDHDAAVVADAVVGVEDEFAGAAAGEVEAAGRGVVEPLVIAACICGDLSVGV